MTTLTEAELDKLEDAFYEDDGDYHIMTDQVTAHIAKHRNVTDYKFNSAMSFDEIDKKEKEMQDTGQYRDLVAFSAYEDYQNNLDKVAIEGRVMMKTEHQSFFGGMAEVNRKDYESEVLENPTWLDLCLCANDMINCTGDNHHVFLEAVHKTGQFTLDDKSFVLIYDFSMGS